MEILPEHQMLEEISIALFQKLKKKKKKMESFHANQNIGQYGDFPVGPVVTNLPSNARDACLIPGWGTKIPHAMG